MARQAAAEEPRWLEPGGDGDVLGDGEVVEEFEVLEGPD